MKMSNRLRSKVRDAMAARRRRDLCPALSVLRGARTVAWPLLTSALQSHHPWRLARVVHFSRSWRSCRPRSPQMYAPAQWRPFAVKRSRRLAKRPTTTTKRVSCRRESSVGPNPPTHESIPEGPRQVGGSRGHRVGSGRRSRSRSTGEGLTPCHCPGTSTRSCRRTMGPAL